MFSGESLAGRDQPRRIAAQVSHVRELGARRQHRERAPCHQGAGARQHDLERRVRFCRLPGELAEPAVVLLGAPVEQRGMAEAASAGRTRMAVRQLLGVAGARPGHHVAASMAPLPFPGCTRAFSNFEVCVVALACQSGRVGGVINAVVFDLDGVLIDSEPVWEEVRRHVVAEHGGQWAPYSQRRLMGMSTTQWAAYLTTELGVRLPPDRVASVVIEQMAARYREHLPLLPAAVPAVRRLGEHWPLGLAS